MHGTFFLSHQNEANTYWMLIVSTSCLAAYSAACIRDNLFAARLLGAGQLVSTSLSRAY